MDRQYDFSNIAPFDDNEFKPKMAQLVKEPGFEHAVRYVMPDVDYDDFVKMLLTVPDKKTFQEQIMVPFLDLLQRRTTSGISMGGIEHIQPSVNYTFMSNHRDIVLDASFLNYGFVNNGLSTSEIAIGNNLLIYDWITDLVKLNKSFIVLRNLPVTKALEAARQLSAYIHYTINQKHESVWIAQREGRAKDSNDLTQESLIKMLSLEGGGQSGLDNLKSINVMPVSISYEFDPNDYLKAREFLLKKLDPNFKKSQHDDLLSMETGLLKPKGHVHFQLTPCINPLLEGISPETPKPEILKQVCHIIDCAIHSSYKIYPINYVAYDIIHKECRFADCYTSQQLKEVEDYVESQLQKVDLPDLSKLDREFMREMMYVMYANPLRNKLKASVKS